MEQEPGTQERGPYNLRTDFESVRSAMADVEGDAWLKNQIAISQHWDEFSEGEQYVSLEAARRWLDTVSPDEDAWKTVYGTFGVDRWYINADGSVRFSKSHAMAENLKKATEKKFWIE